ncbi:MAG: hypothetical protein Q7T11_07640 [Deltaproteobacteria bacterium]|nr:hypothetical protein [Deltaproteobacteria bacterium]
MPKTALKVAGFLFLIVAFLHLSRVVFKINLVIGDTVVPMWANGIGFAVAAGLSWWMFSSVRGK